MELELAELEEQEAACTSQSLTTEQRKLIQTNKERAREVRERKKRVKPYDRPVSPKEITKSPVPNSTTTAGLRNSHAGFMFDDEGGDSGQQHTYQRVEEESQ